MVTPAYGVEGIVDLDSIAKESGPRPPRRVLAELKQLPVGCTLNLDTLRRHRGAPEADFDLDRRQVPQDLGGLVARQLDELRAPRGEVEVGVDDSVVLGSELLQPVRHEPE